MRKPIRIILLLSAVILVPVLLYKNIVFSITDTKPFCSRSLSSLLKLEKTPIFKVKVESSTGGGAEYCVYKTILLRQLSTGHMEVPKKLTFEQSPTPDKPNCMSAGSEFFAIVHENALKERRIGCQAAIFDVSNENEIVSSLK